MAGKEFVASSGEDGFRPYHGAAADEIASGRPLPSAGKMASARITGSPPPTSSRRGGRRRERIGGSAAAERETVWSNDRARRQRCVGSGGGGSAWGAAAALLGAAVAALRGQNGEAVVSAERLSCGKVEEEIRTG
jgi:hypothetical protein